MRRVDRTRGEDGAFLVLYAILVVAMFAMAAIAIDLSSLRQDRRADRGSADAAATAGALVLTDVAGGPLAGCDAAWNGAVRNVGYAPPGPGLTQTPCHNGGSPITSTTTCSAGDAARSVSGTVGNYTITITTPVPDSSDLLKADTAGGDTNQAMNATFDGDQCDRVAVTISLPRTSFFGGIVGSKSNTTTIHSVARALVGPGIGKPIPALVALNKTACQTINGGTGFIEAKNVGNKPGLIQADSDASGCNSSSHVLEVGGNGVRIKADAGTSGSPGLLNYYAKVKPAQAYDTSRPGDYSGALTQLAKPITRSAFDNKVHCSNAGVDSSSSCTAAEDPYLVNIATYATNDPPAPFSTFPGALQSCNSPPPLFIVGNWKINCPSGFTVGSPVAFGGGVLVFTGDVNVVSGGDLLINAAPVNNPVTGLPISLDTNKNTIMAIRGSNGLTMASAASTVQMAQTLVFTPNGGSSFQGGPNMAWTPYTVAGASSVCTPPSLECLNGLLYWSEKASPTIMAFGGGPNFKSFGVVLIPNMQLQIQGSGILDASNVQFWCDSVYTQGAAQFILRPDPNTAFTASGAISHLIR